MQFYYAKISKLKYTPTSVNFFSLPNYVLRLLNFFEKIGGKKGYSLRQQEHYDLKY